LPKGRRPVALFLAITVTILVVMALRSASPGRSDVPSALAFDAPYLSVVYFPSDLSVSIQKQEQQVELGPTGMRAVLDQRTASGARGTVTIAQMPVASNLLFLRQGTPIAGKNRELEVKQDSGGGQVIFLDRGIHVTVKGTVPLEELIKIADSMR
jgi:hypothetical protein